MTDKAGFEFSVSQDGSQMKVEDLWLWCWMDNPKHVGEIDHLEEVHAPAQ
jgi:hypothetical protein